jgi:hypothetical protein
MSFLTVRQTARLTWAVKCRATRAIHVEMLHKRHDVLCGIMRRRFGRRVAALMPPLDVSNPGDIYTTPEVSPLPQRCCHSVLILFSICCAEYDDHLLFHPPLVCAKSLSLVKVYRFRGGLFAMPVPLFHSPAYTNPC